MSRRTVAFLASLAFAMLVPTPAAASCAEFPPLAEHLVEADAVFIGTVIGLRNQDRTAAFEVTEVWRGPDLLPEVVVHGGLDDPNAFSSVDRTFELGGNYLVAARVVDGELVDNACSATQPWHEGLVGLRPEDARSPNGTDSAGDAPGIPLLPVGLGALFVVLVAGSLIAFRRSDQRP